MRWRPRRGAAAAAGMWGAVILASLLSFPSIAPNAGGTLVTARTPLPAHGSIRGEGPRASTHAFPSLPGASVQGQPAVDVSGRLALGVPPYPSATLRPRSPPPSAPHPDARPIHPLAGGAGWVAGVVIDSVTGHVIANVQVSSTPATGPCVSGCGSATTDIHGAFNVTAPVGPTMVVFDDSAYLENKTYPTVADNATTRVGTVLLVHMGYAHGVVRSYGPSHLPLGNVSVLGTSLDGLVNGPGNITGANGSFWVDVPPVPSIVTFDPPGYGYTFLENQTWVNVTPYGIVDLGTIYIESGFWVKATLTDRSTGLPIPSTVPTQLWVCTLRGASDCRPGPLGAGPHVEGPGTAGASRIRAMAFGYVVNDTSVADLPLTDGFGTVNIGTVFVTPMGVLQVSTNISGPRPTNQTWPTNGSAIVELCTLDGVDVATYPWFITPVPELLANPCWGGPESNAATNTYALGSTGRVLGPPLRDTAYLAVHGLVFPVAGSGTPGSAPPSPIPGGGANFTWANLTPDQVTFGGSFDLTPGGLITGRVHVGTTGTYPRSTTDIHVCSTDEQWVCAGALSTVAGCLTGTDAFCVTAPPGPVRVTVTVANLGQNWTWVESPSGCCRQVGTAVNVGVINITPGLEYGAVNGTVWVNDAPPGQHLPSGGLVGSVEACPVGPSLATGATSGSSPCLATPINRSTGAFNMTPPIGWNRLRAFATGYQPNWTWIDVTGNNSSGIIVLGNPVGTLTGQVLTASGTAVYAAQVQACYVSDPSQCVNVGPGGLTSTYGQYYGTVPASPYPAGAYEVVATAAGYATNWTFANITGSQLVTAPTIHLAPLGVNASRLGPHRFGAPSVGAWVDGRVIDASTLLGVPAVYPLACIQFGGGCSVLTQPTQFGGEFNESLPAGAYHLYLNASDHAPFSLFLNLSAASFLHLGVLRILHLPRLTGVVGIYPWRSLTELDGLGPSRATVELCDATGGTCGTLSTVGTDGSFNVSGPYGSADQLVIRGAGINLPWSPGNGFDLLQTTVDVNAPLVQLPTTGPSLLLVRIFGWVTGSGTDGSSWNATVGAATRPVPFVIGTALSNGPNGGYDTFIAGGGGRLDAFLPSDGSQVALTESATAFWPSNETLPGAVPAAREVNASALALPHEGWVTTTLTDASTRRPIPATYVKVSFFDAKNGTNVSREEQTNGNGYVNVTAPTLGSDTLATESPFYANQSRQFAIGPSRTDALSAIVLKPDAGRNGTWVESTHVNTVGVPVVETVVDAKYGTPIYDASVLVTTASGSSSHGVVSVNGIGQFLSLVDPDPADQLKVSAAAYTTFAATYDLPAASRLVVNRVPMVGDGIVAGRVVVEPSGLPAPGVEVMGCPTSLSVCSNAVLTNGAGVFWIDAPTGNDTFTVVTDAYLSNWTVNLDVTTDSFRWLGGFPVYAFAHIHGSMRGLPSGLPLGGGNASLCSPLGSPAGPCFESVTADAAGNFTLVAPPSNYVIELSDAGYNTSYLPVSVLPGQRVEIGLQFLFADGLAQGTVVSSSNGAPIPNATVTACSPWIPGTCLPPAVSNASGGFVVELPPGSSQLDIAAPGFNDNYTSVTVVSGNVTRMGRVALSPFIYPYPATVTGTVRASAGRSPIPDATIVAYVGGVRTASTSTDASGNYDLAIYHGTFTLQAGAFGYRDASIPLTVLTNLSGVDFLLEGMSYVLSGTVTDRATGAPLADVQIANGTRTIATTATDGTYLAALPNGSYSLTAIPPSNTVFFPLAFGVEINGGDVVRNLTLEPGGDLTTITVVERTSGSPIQGAIVAVSGVFESAPITRSGVTGPSGNFTFRLPAGNYSVSVSASDLPVYAGAITIPVPGGVDLVELGGVSAVSTALLPGGWVGGAILGGVAVAEVALGLLVYRRKRGGGSEAEEEAVAPSPLPRQWLTDRPDDEVEWKEVGW